MKNEEVAAMFESIAQLLEIKGRLSIRPSPTAARQNPSAHWGVTSMMSAGRKG